MTYSNQHIEEKQSLKTSTRLGQHGEITTDEANIIISTEQEVRDDENSGFRLSRLKMPTKPDIRYVRIAHLYAYVYKWISYSLDTCGLHEKAVISKVP